MIETSDWKELAEDLRKEVNEYMERTKEKKTITTKHANLKSSANLKVETNDNNRK
jgi:hypothetical protein